MNVYRHIMDDDSPRFYLRVVFILDNGAGSVVSFSDLEVASHSISMVLFISEYTSPHIFYTKVMRLT